MSDLRGLNKDVVKEFKVLATSKGMDDSQLLKSLIENFESDGFKLSPDDQKIVDQAVKNGADLNQLLTRGLVSEAKYHNSTFNKLSEYESMPTQELKKVRVRGVSDLIINRAFKAIKAYNSGVENVSDMIKPTESTLFKITGSNRQGIKQWLENNSLEVNKYLSDMGFSDNHRNQNVAVIDLKALDATI